MLLKNNIGICKVVEASHRKRKTKVKKTACVVEKNSINVDQHQQGEFNVLS